jgi:hypothetical protein
MWFIGRHEKALSRRNQQIIQKERRHRTGITGKLLCET